MGHCQYGCFAQCLKCTLWRACFSSQEGPLITSFERFRKPLQVWPQCVLGHPRSPLNLVTFAANPPCHWRSLSSYGSRGPRPYGMDHQNEEPATIHGPSTNTNTSNQCPGRGESSTSFREGNRSVASPTEERVEPREQGSPEEPDVVDPGFHAESILSWLNHLRRLQPTRTGHRQQFDPAPGLEFSVMSYNVLSQELLELNYDLYDTCHPGVLDWNYRKQHLLRELMESNADVICLQEVDANHYEETFLPVLTNMGYAGKFKKRTGNKNDGCAIFYNVDVFYLDDSVEIEFCKPGVRILDRDNIALVVALRPRRPSGGTAKLCVATTHLLFNPGRGDIKLAQLNVLLAEIDKLAFKEYGIGGEPVYHPIILCGDMNSEPYGELYRFVSTGILRYEGLIAGDISGQQEGFIRGRFPLPKELLPDTLGVSDQCQYVDVLSKRLQDSNSTTANNGEASREGSAKSSEPAGDLVPKDPVSPLASFSSGWLSHKLNLMSVYNHYLERLRCIPEVTTHHSKASCTVDYIFYSVKRKNTFLHRGCVVHRQIEEAKLKLLGYHDLLATHELNQMGGLPNPAMPSDHLPLLARFLLDCS